MTQSTTQAPVQNAAALPRQHAGTMPQNAGTVPRQNTVALARETLCVEALKLGLSESHIHRLTTFDLASRVAQLKILTEGPKARASQEQPIITHPATELSEEAPHANDDTETVVDMGHTVSRVPSQQLWERFQTLQQYTTQLAQAATNNGRLVEEFKARVEPDTLTLMQEDLKNTRELYQKARQEMLSILQTYKHLTQEQRNDYKLLHQRWRHTGESIDKHMRQKLVMYNKRIALMNTHCQ